MPRLPFSRGDEVGPGDASDAMPLLAILERSLRDRVRKRLTRRRVPAGRELFRHGEMADALYLVETGRFRVSVRENAGRERVLQFVGQGELLGEAAFMAETPYVTSAIATEASVVLRLARNDFEALLGKNEPALRHLASVIAARQEQANARFAAETAPEELRAQRGFMTAMYSPRGGAGVTTLAVNTAIVLAERHPDDVALLDLDVLFGHAAGNLWLEPRGVLAQVTPNVLRSLERSGIDFYLLRHASSLRVFPAATKPEEGQTITGDHVRAAVSVLRKYFGHIVLDLPHALDEVTLSALEIADRVVVVATPEAATLKDVLETRRILIEALKFPPEHICYALNHPQPYAALSISEVSAATATPWFDIGYGEDAPAAAALRGESLPDTHPANAVVRGVAALADTLGRLAREHAELQGHPT